MDTVESIRRRKSIRAFKSDPVSKEMLREIMEVALRAPSRENTQPWQFAIVTGTELEQIRRAFLEKARAGEQAKPDVLVPEEYPEPYDTRRRSLGGKLFEVAGIQRGDWEKRMEWGLRGLGLFGAPCAIYMYVDRHFHFEPDRSNLWAAFDCGLVAENIMLLATTYGLGTVPEIQAVVYPDILRNVLKIPDSKLILLGIAIGYPDWTSPLNEFQSPRESLDSVANWYGFD